MAGLISKRQREEAEEAAQIEETKEGEELKRHKSYNQILSLLDEDEEEPIEDLSSIITTLQQEISSPPPDHRTSFQADPTTPRSASVQDYTNFSSTSSSSSSSSSSVTSPNSAKELDQEGERERVMRHLLEASDDELGIPNAELFVGEGLDGVALCDALWELEDEAANYYTLFQSHLFM